MSESEIDTLVWYEKRHRMVVTYGDGRPDRIVATERVAAMLADDAGLVLVPSPPGMVRWVRDPDSEALSRGQERRVQQPSGNAKTLTK